MAAGAPEPAGGDNGGRRSADGDQRTAFGCARPRLVALGVVAARFALIAIGVAGVVATALTAWAVSRSPILVDPKGTSIWRSLVVASYVGVGLYHVVASA